MDGERCAGAQDAFVRMTIRQSSGNFRPLLSLSCVKLGWPGKTSSLFDLTIVENTDDEYATHNIS